MSRLFGLTSILLFALAIRLLVVCACGGAAPVIEDAKDYDRLAVSLLETGRYATPSGELSSLRPPLYPALVAAIYRCFGPRNYLAVYFAQAFMSCGVVYFTFKIGEAAYDRNIGLIAAVAFALYPSLIAFNCLLLTEVLFTLFFSGAVYFSLQLLDKPGAKSAIALGLCLGLGALTRSVLLPCGLLVAAYIALFAKASFVDRLRFTTLALAVLVAVLAPWTVRNSIAQKTFTVVDVMGGRNVMMGNYEFTPLERSWATIGDVTGDKSWISVLLKHEERKGKLTQGELDKKAMKYGVKFFISHPKLSAVRLVVRFFNFWQLDRTIVAGLRQGIFGETSRMVVLASMGLFCGGYAILFLSGVAGSIVSPPTSAKHGLLLLWLAVPCLVHTLAFAHSRYHKPLMPIVCVFAAAFCQLLISRGPRPSRVRLGFAAFALLVFILGWLREVLLVDLALLK